MASRKKVSPNELQKTNLRSSDSVQNFTYIDLFAGCGGLSLGLHKAGWSGVFAVEKNSDAFSTLNHNLSDHFNWPSWLPRESIDINILLEKYNDELRKLEGTIDLIVGGPPCQGFSMAGKRIESDFRNQLCHSYLKFVEIVKPKMIFFENVRGFTHAFKTSDESEALPYSKVVLEKLEKLGYSVAGNLVNISEYGVPQKRIRYIIVGVLNGDSKAAFELLEQNRKQFLQDNNLPQKPTLKQAIGDLEKSNGEVQCPDAPNYKSGLYKKGRPTNYQARMRANTKATVPNSHRFAKHNEETIRVFRDLMSVSNKAIRITPSDNMVLGLKKRGVTPLKEGSVCGTVTSIPDDFVHYSEPRIMTVREMARIQSFPDDYEFKGRYTTGGIRRKIDVPRYTQVANAVPPLFAEQVGLALKEVISNEE